MKLLKFYGDSMKRYSLNIDSNLIDYHSIRNKWDVITLIIDITKILISHNCVHDISILGSNNTDSIKVVIYVDKMSRVFIIEENKIHSIQFPFIISSKLIQFNNISIDSFKLSILSRVFYNISSIKPLLFFIERLWELQDELYLDDNLLCQIEELIVCLFTFEPGYIRYDYDVLRVTEGHPLNHFDFYYSSNNTFKIGLNKEIDVEQFCSIVDITDTCYNLEEL